MLFGMLYSFMHIIDWKFPSWAQFTDVWWSWVTDPIQSSIDVNFYGNFSSYHRAYEQGDVYAKQLVEMGAVLGCDHGRHVACTDIHCFKPIYFPSAMHYLKEGLQGLIVPVLVLESLSKDGRGLGQGYVDYFGSEPRDLLTGNLVNHSLQGNEHVAWKPVSRILNPDEFVSLLARGCFVVGGPETGGTNQSLAEHDMAHLAGFLANPAYGRQVVSLFARVKVAMLDPDIALALKRFDSILSLRLYYFVEVATAISPEQVTRLYKLLSILKLQLDCLVKVDTVVERLETIGRSDPVGLFRFLHQVYAESSSLLEPLGGESRDINNRVRKHSRGFYSSTIEKLSKFAGSSIYSLCLDGQAALERARPDHEDFASALAVHARYICTLIGTSRLTPADWADACLNTTEEGTYLRRYLSETGIFDKSHAIYRTYCGRVSQPLSTSVEDVSCD